ncbi:GNAT family N-acetyltransferase [Vacuolonema iberomarrocanum]|uniref:GNAT family N-acetyltransferase n=1 Tax=Vacuolonema iberomarrocanum TaxID=3454632 RepID=UPI001A096A54|nr:GNAT family N-acetyltransferase [filamentous cyanobacterium LEGE 07170]
MPIRIAQETDLAELSELFRRTVLTHAPQCYSLTQTQAWASSATDKVFFRAFILGPTTYVVEDETGIIGFAGIASDGHVISVYVRSDRLHRGIGSTLMQVILDHAITHNISRLYSEASEFSIGLFKKFGFQLYDTEVIERKGATFTRYLMERHLNG